MHHDSDWTPHASSRRSAVALDMKLCEIEHRERARGAVHLALDILVLYHRCTNSVFYRIPESEQITPMLFLQGLEDIGRRCILDSDRVANKGTSARRRNVGSTTRNYAMD